MFEFEAEADGREAAVTEALHDMQQLAYSWQDKILFRPPRPKCVQHHMAYKRLCQCPRQLLLIAFSHS